MKTIQYILNYCLIIFFSLCSYAAPIHAAGNLYAVDTGTNAGIANTPWPKFHRDIRSNGIMERFSFSPSFVKIWNIGVHETREGAFIVRNYDTEPLTIEHIGIDNDQFKIFPESAVVMPSDSLLITVTFSPVTEDEQQAIIMVHTDGREIPVYVFGNPPPPPPEPILAPVRLITRDGDTGELLPCRVYFSDSNGRYWMPEDYPLDYRWFFNSPGDTTLIVPTGKYTLSIFRGNEYVPIQNETVDISEGSVSSVTVEKSLVRWINMRELGWYSCDNQVNEFGGNNPRGI